MMIEDMFNYDVQETPSPEFIKESRYRINAKTKNDHVVLDIVYNTDLERFIVDPTISKYSAQGNIQLTQVEKFKKERFDFIESCNPIMLDTKEKVAMYNKHEWENFEKGTKTFDCLLSVDQEAFKELYEKLVGEK